MGELAQLSSHRLARCRTLIALGCLAFPALADEAALREQFLQAADRGECIERVVRDTIRHKGASQATLVVGAALAALQQRAVQQRSLGCEGDIAAQAIAAGADPDAVLRATAAGL